MSLSEKTRMHSCFHSASSMNESVSVSSTLMLKMPWKTRERSRRLKR